MQGTFLSSSGVSLGDLLPDSRCFGGKKAHVTSCCGDSRQCKEGDVFVAIVGSRHDGHDHVHEAIERGAVAVLAERPLPVSVPVIVVDDTRDAYGRVCHALAGHPADVVRTIGVTGTHGKTITSMLIASVLEEDDRPTGIMGSLGYCDGRKTLSDVAVTPPPAQLANWLRSMANNDCQHAVVEASSEGLAQRRLSGVDFDVAVLTNIRRAHIDQHGSVVNYRRIKARLFEQLKPEGVAVINADDPASCALLSKIDHPVITFGINQAAELTARVVERHSSEQTFMLSAGSESVPVRTSMIGDHHVYNCLAAAAVGLASGVDLATVVRGLESLHGVPGRMEQLGLDHDFATFVDVACAPDSLAASLKSLRPVTSGRLICVFGARGRQDHEERPLLGRVAERYSDLTVITSNNPRDEEPLRIAHDILDGCQYPGRAHVLPDRARAIGWALGEARRGDTILIAGRGNERVQCVGDQEVDFDDRDVVRYLLRSVGQAPIAFPRAA
jgi:UDP-N-acetylmuramoyl-L-alanyl-D-glutamate--2,6-diaminopimelate ligase